jgi:hypothetical protein
MTITLHDPVRPMDQRPRLPQPEDDAVGDRRTLPPFRDELRQRMTMNEGDLPRAESEAKDLGSRP